MNYKLMPIEAIAKKFKQTLDSCLEASIMFSLALQYRDTEYPENEILRDMKYIVDGGKSFRELEWELRKVSVDDSDFKDWFDGGTPYAYNKKRAEIIIDKQQEKLRNYLASSGYTIEMRIPSMEQLEMTIKSYPLIYLLYPRYEFFAMPTPFIQHVICAVGIKDNDLVFFEPYVGEIRERKISMVEEMWKGLGIIKQTIQ